MKRSGFSMIELVFVIVILGVLAAVAVPRFVTTRTDAQVAMARSDIATALKAIPAKVFAENIDPTQTTPPPIDGVTYDNWGAWIIEAAGLDKSRWEAREGTIGPKGNVTENGKATDKNFCGAIIKIENGNLVFDPNGIKVADGNGSTFCTSLRDSYPSGSNRIIHLATTGSVKF